ncbi:Twinfilin-1 [Xanthoria calcicola]
MQSGITASPDLHTQFRSFLTTPTLFALLITITSERLEPHLTIPFPSPETNNNTVTPFHTTLKTHLTPHLHPNAALYILLRRHPNDHDPSPITPITYIPTTAPVRTKTLFAATRATLMRELGAGGHSFAPAMFATEAADLVDPRAWEEEREGDEGEVMSKEEREREGLKVLEGDVVGEKRGMVGMQKSGGMKVGVGEGVREALEGLKGEEGGKALVMLKIDQDEHLALAGVEDVDIKDLATAISDTEPRYSFFRYRHDVQDEQQPTTTTHPIIFIYTCPAASKVKERMIYASFKGMVLETANVEAGLEIAKKLEASSPAEITPEMLGAEFQPRQEQKQGFARPKRPGKR